MSIVIFVICFMFFSEHVPSIPPPPPPSFKKMLLPISEESCFFLGLLVFTKNESSRLLKGLNSRIESAPMAVGRWWWSVSEKLLLFCFHSPHPGTLRNRVSIHFEMWFRVWLLHYVFGDDDRCSRSLYTKFNILSKWNAAGKHDRRIWWQSRFLQSKQLLLVFLFVSGIF